jgi:adenine-specific DNA methylase/very-short-patch-repair endonuclease
MSNRIAVTEPGTVLQQQPISSLLSPISYKGAQGLAADVRYYGQWMRDEAERRIGQLYPKVTITPELAADRPDLKPLVGQQLTVIAWLWARTVKSPNPAFAHVEVPLASTFMLSTKPGKEAYVEPVIAGDTYRFTVKVGKPQDPERAKRGTKLARGANFECLLSGMPITDAYIKAESMAGRMGARLLAIVAEGPRGRVYLPPIPEHEEIARQAQPAWRPDLPMNRETRDLVSGRGYGFFTWADLFTPRQLVALTTFADLVGEAMERVKVDYGNAPTPTLPRWGRENAPTPTLPRWGRENAPSSSLPLAGGGQEGGLSAAGNQEGGLSIPVSLPLAGGGQEGGLPHTESKPVQAHWSPTPVPPALLQTARELRQNMTDAEQLLWRCLRGKQLDGFRFRKQHPIEHYVLDFYCPSARLAIEVDGSQHYTPEGMAKDAARTAWLAERGIRVLRFTNLEVLSNLEGVLSVIWEALHVSSMEEDEENAPTPTLPRWGREKAPSSSLPPAGGGQEGGLSAEGNQEGGLPTPSSSLPPAGGGQEGGLSAEGNQEGSLPTPSSSLPPAGGGQEGGLSAGEGQEGVLANAQAYAEAVGVYLGIALSRLTDILNALCRWEVTKTQVRNLFGRQAIPMVWDFAENNVFGNAAGDYLVSLENMVKALERLPASIPGESKQADAATQTISTDKIISTDPPYYDNIGYADLSDFFYVWLRRTLRPVYPDLFATVAVPKAEELVATPYRHGSKAAAEHFFMDGMTKALQRLAAQAHPAFPVTIYYAFKQSEIAEPGARASGAHGDTPDAHAGETPASPGVVSTGWETFLSAVIRAGFAISGTWPMRTELSNRMVGRDTNALASSIVLVCRQRPSDAPVATRREFVQALKAELPRALRELQAGNIAPVDLAQAAIGPGMAVYSRYAQVLDAQGQPVTVREALTLINQVLDETLTEQEGDFDADTRWALAWFEQYGFDEGEFGVAETLSKAKNTSVEGLVEAGILEAKRGRVRLFRPAELPADWDPAHDARCTHWEVVHQLIRVLETGGEVATAVLLTKLGSRADVARELAYRLYSICERKQWADEALSYNALVQSWGEVVRLAGERTAGMAVQQGMEL